MSTTNCSNIQKRAALYTFPDSAVCWHTAVIRIFNRNASAVGTCMTRCTLTGTLNRNGQTNELMTFGDAVSVAKSVNDDDGGGEAPPVRRRRGSRRRCSAALQCDDRIIINRIIIKS